MVDDSMRMNNLMLGQPDQSAAPPEAAPAPAPAPEPAPKKVRGAGGRFVKKEAAPPPPPSDAARMQALMIGQPNVAPGAAPSA